MKKVITAVATLALLSSAASTAFAQEGRWRGDRRGGEGQRAQNNTGDGGYNPAVRRSSRNNPDNAPAAQAPQRQVQPTPQPQPQQAAPQARGGDGQRWRGDRDNNQRRGDNNDRRDRGDRDGNRNWGNRNWDGDGRRDWNHADRDRNWNGGDRDRDRNWNDRRAERPRYDRRNYPSVYRLDRRYQGPRYRPPSGFYVRSWGYGDVLPRGWYGGQYRIDDWWSYGLPIPPIGYDWVRVGDDVLLVDSFNGRVVQVIYDAFW